MQAKPRCQIIATAFSKHLAMVVGVKFVDHHAIQARQHAHFIGQRLAKALHSVHSLQPGHRFFDQRVVVGLMARARCRQASTCARAGSTRGLEFHHHHAVDGMDSDIHRRNQVALRQREGVNGIALGGLCRQNAAQPLFTFDLDDCSHAFAEQLRRSASKDGLGVFARLQNRQIRQPQHQQRTMRLNTAGRADGLSIAIADVEAMTLGAVGLRIPRRAGSGLRRWGGSWVRQTDSYVFMHGDLFRMLLVVFAFGWIRTSDAALKRSRWRCRPSRLACRSQARC